MNRLTSLKRSLFVSLALGLTVVAGGCNDRFSTAADYAATAEAQFASGNLVEARENIQRAISARDDVAEYFILMGRIELQAKSFPSAFSAYSRALDLQADNIEVLQAIAELGLQTDRLKEAETAADRMLLLAPGATRALLVKGFIAMETGRRDEAKKFAQELIAQNPNDEGGAILTARILALDGQFADAVNVLNKAVQTVGESEALSATLLEIYRAQGNAQGLRAMFPRVVAAAGVDSIYQLDFVNFLYKTGDVASARREVWKAIAAQPNDLPMLASLVSLLQEYDADPFSAAQHQWLATSGTRATRLALAKHYLDSEGYDKAQKILGSLITERAVEAEALMARIALAQAKPKETDRLVETVLARDPRNPDALLARSSRRLTLGQIDGAIEDANVVVSDAPREYAGHAALANAYLAQGSKVRARQVYERGVDLLPQSELMAARYDAFLRQVGETARVVSLYGDVASAKPSSLKAWRNYAAVCKELGNRVCQAKVDRSLTAATRSFVIDEPPGTPRTRGLFAKITPEQICRSSGGICTGN